jgi:hypothetical protein
MTIAWRALPWAPLALLEAWVLMDLLSGVEPRWALGFGIVWAANVGLLAVAGLTKLPAARSAALVALGIAYLGLHAIFLGIQLLPALLFVALMIGHIEVRILAERFGPLLAATPGGTDRRRIEATLFRALFRLSVALAIAIAIPLLASDVAAAGLVPASSVPTALALSAALIVVVVLLAILPSYERRRP